MSYETKLYIVRKLKGGHKTNITITGSSNCYHYFGEEGREHHYGRDGATKTLLTPDCSKVERNWTPILCTLALGKINLTYGRGLKDTDLFFYDTDGNTPVVLDKYNAFLKEVSLQECIDILKENPDWKSYHTTTIKVLQAFLEKKEDLTLLIYGH